MRKSRRIAVDVAALAASALTWSFSGRSRSPTAVLAGLDVFAYFYPYRDFASEAMRAARLPLWNPYLFIGRPCFFSGRSRSPTGYWPGWTSLPTFIPTAISPARLPHFRQRSNARREVASLESVPVHGRAAAGKLAGRRPLPAQLAPALALRAQAGGLEHRGARLAGRRRHLSLCPRRHQGPAPGGLCLGHRLCPRRLSWRSGRAREPTQRLGLAALAAPVRRRGHGPQPVAMECYTLWRRRRCPGPACRAHAGSLYRVLWGRRVRLAARVARVQSPKDLAGPARGRSPGADDPHGPGAGSRPTTAHAGADRRIGAQRRDALQRGRFVLPQAGAGLQSLSSPVPLGAAL